MRKEERERESRRTKGIGSVEFKWVSKRSEESR